MAFSEAVKLTVNRKAHFRCCICRRHGVSVEVHHIIPEAQGGPDTEDNAVTLCPTCHEEYGANPNKQRAIRVQRDFWYEICERQYAPALNEMERLAALLEGTTSAITGFQEYVNRITKPESEMHTRTVPQGLTLGASPGELRLEGHPATFHVSTQDSGQISAHESASVEVIEGDEPEWAEWNAQQEPRTEIEILEALERLFDQIWYSRHWNFRVAVEEGREKVSPEIWKTALEAAARVEAKYKDDPEALGPWDDFEWGMLNGKVSALRWVLGDEWDFLDT